jgi:hypothetical protein
MSLISLSIVQTSQVAMIRVLFNLAQATVLAGLPAITPAFRKTTGLSTVSSTTFQTMTLFSSLLVAI